VSKAFPTVGVIGAGQLARMSIAPATALGVNLLLLAADSSDSAAQITQHVVGDYTDLATVREFAAQCDVITFEHELIPLSIIKALEAEGVVVRPSSAAFEFSQDKAAMRQRLQGFPSPKFQIITATDQVDKFPVIAKAISGGYDGRGVWKVNSANELSGLLQQMPKLVVEELIEFDFEIAVMVARSPHGQATTWAPTQTIQKDGICVMTISPSFEQHLRAVLDLPLGDPSMTAPMAVMGNVLGGNKTDMYRPYLHLMARTPALHFHQYKKDVRPGRKIGHVTLLGKDLVELTQEVQHAVDYMSGEIDE